MSNDYTITKQFHWSSSHVLDGLPDEHPCSRLHGHNYVAVIELAAERLDPVGFVVDYGDLTPVKAWIDETWDHRHLNDAVGLNPTAENLAYTLYWQIAALLPQVTAVTIHETPKTTATYRPHYR